MKTCNNCYWKEQCEKYEGFKNQRCEDYDPIFSAENIIIREYREDLKERLDDYQELIKEQQSGQED